MKTPMQELLERVQEYRDSETSPLVISRLNSICVDIIGMLEKEKDVMCKFAYKCHKKHKVYGDFMIQDYYNETFNTKEK